MVVVATETQRNSTSCFLPPPSCLWRACKLSCMSKRLRCTPCSKIMHRPVDPSARLAHQPTAGRQGQLPPPTASLATCLLQGLSALKTWIASRCRGWLYTEKFLSATLHIMLTEATRLAHFSVCRYDFFSVFVIISPIRRPRDKQRLGNTVRHPAARIFVCVLPLLPKPAPSRARRSPFQ